VIVENRRDDKRWEPLLERAGCPIFQHDHSTFDPYRGEHVATQHSFRRIPEELERLAVAIRAGAAE
jgi:hypothetical protein